MKRLIITKDLDGKPAAYMIDMTAIHKIMTEMPILTNPEPTKFDPIMTRAMIDFGPVVLQTNAILMSDMTTMTYPDPFRFVFLFPLGKRGYVKS